MVPACPLRQPYMVFLFVGSSGLTEASFPRNLAIPQLLLSSAWAILPLVMRASPTTVFPHRGLSPHQFTPMSGAHQVAAANAGRPSPCQSEVIGPAWLDSSFAHSSAPASPLHGSTPVDIVWS